MKLESMDWIVWYTSMDHSCTSHELGINREIWVKSHGVCEKREEKEEEEEEENKR